MTKPTQTPPTFPALVQAYFAEYLTQQRAFSPQTVAAYRDAFVLFLKFAEPALANHRPGRPWPISRRTCSRLSWTT